MKCFECITFPSFSGEKSGAPPASIFSWIVLRHHSYQNIHICGVPEKRSTVYEEATPCRHKEGRFAKINFTTMTRKDTQLNKGANQQFSKQWYEYEKKLVVLFEKTGKSLFSYFYFCTIINFYIF